LALTDTPLSERPLTIEQARRTDRRAVLRQFAQFCTVGAVSTALNIGLGILFLRMGFSVNLAHVCAFTLAVTNGFFWNRAWTFRRARAGRMEQQYAMFVGVNLVGMALSWAIMRLTMAWLLDHQVAHTLAQAFHNSTGKLPDPARLAYGLGELAATPPVAVWNFTANRLWTFGGHSRH
jgi:putative flippase GtrA